MKFRGILKRTVKEYKYFTSKRWSYEDVGNFWNTIHDYDEIDDETYAYKRRFYDSIKMCSIQNNSNVLDIDCRTGNGTVFYHRNGKISQAVCMSPSSNFLKICETRIKKYNIKAKTILLEKLPLRLKDKSFDAILCLETIEHMPRQKRIEFLKELNRLLKDEGELVLSMPNILWEPVHWLVAIFGIHHSEGPHRFLSRKKLKRLLKKTGFKIAKQKTTVIIPVGPRWLTRFGEELEKFMGVNLMHLFGLRHIMIIKK